MACGKPVIATRTNGFEIIEENNSGILIDPENSGEFRDAIMNLLTNKKSRNQMGKNGREIVVENFSWECVAKKVENVCASVSKYNF